MFSSSGDFKDAGSLVRIRASTGHYRLRLSAVQRCRARNLRSSLRGEPGSQWQQSYLIVLWIPADRVLSRASVFLMLQLIQLDGLSLLSAGFRDAITVHWRGVQAIVDGLESNAATMVHASPQFAS